jgi:phage tail protein X
MTHLAISAPPASTPTGQHTGRDQLIAAIPAAVHEAMRKTLPHKYTPDLADAIAAQTIANLTGVTSAPCPAFRDCTDTTPGHFDHFTHDIKVLDDADGSTILDAGMVANSGSDRHVIVYLRNAEFTDPAKLREKTAEVREFLDQVDALADRVFADVQARTEQAGRAEAQA